MSTKFFTNDAGNSVLDKFKGVFDSRSDIAEFDALVGYFRSTGYFSLRPYLENVGQIRILVGINVDKLIQKHHQQGLEMLATDKQAVSEDYQNQLKEEINKADYELELEQSVLQFIADINSEKIKIRAHPSKQLHAKIYIFRPENFNQHSAGEVITGSSNLTAAGLGVGHSPNYEFNVALRDYDDIQFATTEFEKLWQESVQLLPADINKAIGETHIDPKGFTPFELYIKLLMEYFGKEVEFNPNLLADVPKEFTRLKYQMDAAWQGYQIMQKHNGVFLADVVGLGKTVIAILIARICFYKHESTQNFFKTLIITPPALKTNWKDTKDAFQLSNVKVVTNGSLHNVENIEQYNLVIVDEAHKFRNDTSDAYELLQIICKTPTRDNQAKQVILVSATPLNNRPDDIRNQLLLFLDAQRNTLGINLTEFFAPLARKYDQIIRGRRGMAGVTELYESVRTKIIEPLTVRRTRTDLFANEEYRNDLQKENIKFPRIKPPENILYTLDDNLSKLYDETLACIVGKHEKHNLLYTRYKAIQFLNPEHQDAYRRPDFISAQLVGIIRTLLLKRLDSSIFALHQSLKRFRKATETLIEMANNNRIIIAPEYDVIKYMNEKREQELIDILLNQVGSERYVFDKNDFNKRFFIDLKNDLETLSYLTGRWAEIVESEIDPKLDKLIESLENRLLDKARNSHQKLVIFSESLETTTYLTDQLKAKGYNNVLNVSSKTISHLRKDIRENFDANIPKEEQRSDYNILISTEVLAEGVNLHRANTVVNYDIPWNATRLMQRIGRVNRIGTDSDNIYVCNFLPTDQVDADINLDQRARVKLHAFHTALGEDSKIYTPDEEPETFGLFDSDIYEDKTVSQRLKYLMELRKFRTESPDEYARIKKLPLKMRCCIADSDHQNQTIAFLRNADTLAFYKVAGKEAPNEMDFIEVAEIFQRDTSKQTTKLRGFHYAQVKRALSVFSEKIKSDMVAQHQTITLTTQQKQAENYLQAVGGLSFADDEQKTQITQAIRSIRLGRFQELVRRIIKLKKRAKRETIAPAEQLQEVLKIVTQYPHTESVAPKHDTGKPIAPKVVISQSYGSPK